ncbi:MAG TPA: ATP-binding protein, partial [Candidatus Limnocylindrales bacterium]
DLATGWVLIACGLVVWGRRPGSIGTLLVVTGVAWFAGTLLPAAAFLHRGPLVHVLAAYPSGSVRGVGLRLLVATAYLVSAFAVASRLDTVGLAFGGVLIALALRGLSAVRRPLLRSTALSSLATLALGLEVFGTNIARLAGNPIPGWVLYAYEICLAAVALSIVTEILWRAAATGVLTRIVVDLGGPAEAGTLRDRLARAVGDPSLLLGYAVDGVAGAWIDDTGTPIDLPAETPDRSVTPIAVGGRELGFVAHDPAFLSDPRVMSSVAAAVGLAMSNSATQAEIRRRVAEVEASRERLVHAGDAQGRQLEAALDTGAVACLGRAETALQAAAASRPEDRQLADVLRDLGSTREGLREFARGVYPGVLRSGGLAPAMADLAARSPIPVETTLGTRKRFDPAAESTLYFVCAEALANVAKHANSARARIELADRGDGPVVTVSDDGVGGAVVAGGTGLRGLVDRVEALGGSISIDSRAGSGTTIVAQVPSKPARLVVASAMGPRETRRTLVTADR